MQVMLGLGCGVISVFSVLFLFYTNSFLTVSYTHLAKIQAVLRRTYDFNGQTGLLEHRGAILSMSDADVYKRQVQTPSVQAWKPF